MHEHCLPTKYPNLESPWWKLPRIDFFYKVRWIHLFKISKRFAIIIKSKTAGVYTKIFDVVAIFCCFFACTLLWQLVFLCTLLWRIVFLCTLLWQLVVICAILVESVLFWWLTLCSCTHLAASFIRSTSTQNVKNNKIKTEIIIMFAAILI